MAVQGVTPREIDQAAWYNEKAPRPTPTGAHADAGAGTGGRQQHEARHGAAHVCLTGWSRGNWRRNINHQRWCG